MANSSDLGTDKVLLRADADVLTAWTSLAEKLGVSRNTALAGAVAGVLSGLQGVESGEVLDLEDFGFEVAEVLVLAGVGHWVLRGHLLNQYADRLRKLEAPGRKWDDVRERDQLVSLVRDRMAKLNEGVKSYGK